MKNEIIFGDCIEKMQDLADGSVDAILTDPPYKYLQNQRLEVDFDEKRCFEQFQRVLKKDGMLAIFGRGASFYRWCYLLSELGFFFKEEIIWDKWQPTSPVLPISRVHETIAIFSKGKGKIRSVKIPYIEQKQFDIEGILNDLNRIKSTIKKADFLKEIEEFLDSGKIKKELYVNENRGMQVTMKNNIKTADRGLNALFGMVIGMKEKSIINIPREHYGHIHETQKPIRLIERLLLLISDENDFVLDPFCGSGSTTIACINQLRNSLTFEIDKRYFDAAEKRIISHPKRMF